jgi:uncharacterized protein (TIGR03435 family)
MILAHHVFKLAASILAGSVCAAQPPAFEVASVRPVKPQLGPIMINLGATRHGKLNLTNTRFADCLRFAYSIASDSQIAGPEWIKSKAVRFDIVGQAGPDTSRDQLLLMLQTLLADRFKLTLHTEKRELPFYALVVAKNGPKIQRTKPGVSPPKISFERGRMIRQTTMPVLATLLALILRGTVLDMTGLQGLFDINMEWEPDDGRTPDGIASGPSLFTAVQEQLGLKLESRKGPVDVLVVDQAEQVPAEN